MPEIINKRDRSRIIRERIRTAMRLAQVTQAGLAEKTGVDRSTISQVLMEDSTRVPNAHFIASTGEVLGVSADWLLGLTDRPEKPSDLLAAHVRVTEAHRSAFDEQIMQWHHEAEGYKIRHVPATLPDMLKTDAMQHWEFAHYFSKTPDQAVRATEDLVEWLQSSGSDYEISMPLHEIESCAKGEGYYHGLDWQTRLQQINHIRDIHERLFPRLRITLFDARQVYSSPLTVYGPLVGVLYVGRFYLAFRESDRIRRLAEHFDYLVRESVVDSRNLSDFLDGCVK
jgi:transcriptional regulator with XRE-family HTH domain